MWKHVRKVRNLDVYFFLSEGGRQVTVNPFSFMVSVKVFQSIFFYRSLNFCHKLLKYIVGKVL